MLNLSCDDDHLGFPYNTKKNIHFKCDHPRHIPAKLLSNDSLVSNWNNLEIFSHMLNLSCDGGHLGFPIYPKRNTILQGTIQVIKGQLWLQDTSDPL